jgi:LysR family transcriptional regulator, hydrogen peroxide-inducible genes activator
MTLQELRYLVAVADSRHFGRAAEACHVSQPTLSTQLKKLEEYLGVMIFERTHRSVRVTPVGGKIIALARRVVEGAEQIHEFAQSQQGPFAEPLRLGVIPTLGPYVLPWLIPPLQRKYPELKLVVREDLTAQLVERIHNHQLDAALLSLPIPDAELVAWPLFDEPFWVVCPTNDPLARKSSVSVADLDGKTLLLMAEGHCFRDQALEICGTHVPDTAHESDFRAASLETIRQMVAAGFGCTLLPALALPGPAWETSRVKVLRFNARKGFRRVGLVWRESFPRVDDLKLLGTFIGDHLPEKVRVAKTAGRV